MKKILLTAAALMLVAATAQAALVVENGSFELPDLGASTWAWLYAGTTQEGWKNHHGETFWQSPSNYGWEIGDAHDGNQVLGVRKNARVSQGLGVVEGGETDITITFAHALQDGMPAPANVRVLLVDGGWNLIAGFTNLTGSSTSSWTTESFTATNVPAGTPVRVWFDTGDAGTGGNEAILFDSFAVSTDPAGGFVQGTPDAIDGAYDEKWSGAEVYTGFFTVDGSAPDDAADLSAQFRAMWDTNNLYVLVEVSDEAHILDSAGWSDDDSIEIYTDVNNEDRAYAAGDSNIFQTAGLIDLTGPYPATITSDGINPVSGATIKMVVNADSYVLEVAIPWANLSAGGYTPAIGSLIGFGIGINDDDVGGSRDTQVMWATTTNALSQNSAHFPTVRLLAKPLEFFKGTPDAIDGAYDAEWSGAHVYTNFYTVDGSPPDDAADLSAQLRAMWDADNLYVLVEVFDEAFILDGPYAWFDDSFEIYTDVNAENRTYAAGDSNIFQTAGLIDLTGPYPATITPYGSNPVSGATIKMVVNADSYVVEAAIPWANLSAGGYTPVKGSPIGFGFGINDDDDGDGRDTQIMWATTSALLWINSENFPKVPLIGAPAAPLIVENGSFELPDLGASKWAWLYVGTTQEGWKNHHGETFWQSPSAYGWEIGDAHDGNQVLGVRKNARVSQGLGVVDAETDITITFAHALQDGMPAPANVRVLLVDGSWNIIAGITNLTGSSTSSWTTESFTATNVAAGEEVRVWFDTGDAGTGGGEAILFDSFTVFRPFTLAIESLSGTNAIAVSWNTQALVTYALQQKAGLNDPVWADDITNIEGTGGGVVVTTAVDQAQSFYRVGIE